MTGPAPRAEARAETPAETPAEAPAGARAPTPRHEVSVARGLRELARPWTGRLTLAGAAVLAAAIAALAPALVVRHVIDHNLTPQRTDGLLLAGLIYLGAEAVVATLTAIYGYLAATVAQRSLAGLRTRLFAHLLALPASYHDATPVGDSISRATADVEAIDDLFSSSATTLLAETVRLAAVLVAMALLSPALTGIAMLVVPPLVIITQYLRRRVRDAERSTRVAVGSLNTQLHEDLSAIEVVRAFGRQHDFADRFRRALTNWLTASNRSTYYNAFYAPALGVLSASAVALLLWTGGRGTLGLAGISLGTLTAFVLLFARFFTPLINLGDEWQTVQAALAGAERVFSVLNLPTTQPTAPGTSATADPGPALTPDPVVAAHRVGFGYTPGADVLRDIDLTVHPGEHVAVVGRTGAGKSTLLSLLAGLYPTSSGTIRLLGRDPSTLAEDERQRLLGVVSQQVTLFDGTVHDNLTLGEDTITSEQLRLAAAIAGADRFIQKLPHGYDTLLAASAHGHGVHLSAGQRQLLTLARAMTHQPPLLLLDEATAVIDGDSDAAFRTALHDRVLPTGTAVITVAHRLATARDAHRVLVISDGRIIEQGSPHELLAADGMFAALAALEEAGWDWRHDPDIA